MLGRTRKALLLLLPLLHSFKTDCEDTTLVAGESLIQNSGATMVALCVTSLPDRLKWPENNLDLNFFVTFQYQNVCIQKLSATSTLKL
jgi:hypothetical protein